MPNAAYFSPELQRVVGDTLRPGGLALTDRAMAVCRFSPGSRLLDVGCGRGATIRHLSEAYAMEMWGVDRSFQMLGEAAGRPHCTGRLIQASGMAIPLADDSMNGVFSECVLSLMPDPNLALNEFHRLLQPRGRLVISDLYLRRPEAQGLLATIAVSSCLAGARDKPALMRMTREAGFTVLLWEDHTHLLTQLAVDMIFTHGTMDRFWAFMGDGPEIKQATCRSKPGYFLMIAVKGNECDG